MYKIMDTLILRTLEGVQSQARPGVEGCPRVAAGVKAGVGVGCLPNLARKQIDRLS